jgi:FixJ family two-component response regulator
MTGCDDLRIKRESIRKGVHAYIQKPFYLSHLGQIIINLMRRDDQEEVPAA